MASERSKHRELLAFIFITKSISKKLLIKIKKLFLGETNFSVDWWIETFGNHSNKSYRAVLSGGSGGSHFGVCG